MPNPKLSSQLVVPFRIEKAHYETLFQTGLCSIPSNDYKGVSSVHYLPLVREYCIGKKTERCFLEVSYYNLNRPYIGQKCELVKKSKDVVYSFNPPIHFEMEQPLVVFNNTNFRDVSSGNNYRVGFIVFRVTWDVSGNVDDLMDGLYQSKALRFNGLNDHDACKFHFRHGDHSYFLPDELLQSFREERIDITWMSRRFTSLHLLCDGPDLKRGKVYDLIRTTPENGKSEKHDDGFPILEPSSVKAMVLNEGALVSDHGGHREMFNKYFPAFLLALNLREIFKFRSELVLACAAKGRGFLMKTANEQLEEMKLDRMQQELYYVSDIGEVSSFYKHLHNSFSIDVLIRDVTDSIEALYVLSSVKYEKRVNKSLLIIGLLSVFSAVNDGFGLLELDSQHVGIKLGAVAILFVLLIGAILRNERVHEDNK